VGFSTFKDLLIYKLKMIEEEKKTTLFYAICLIAFGSIECYVQSDLLEPMRDTMLETQNFYEDLHFLLVELLQNL